MLSRQDSPCHRRVILNRLAGLHGKFVEFLWLVLQHVLPKGFRRARNFGFLHPNCKRLIALLHVLLKFAPGQALTWVKQRAPILCPCCGAVMTIVKTQLRSLFSGPLPIPLAAQGAH